MKKLAYLFILFILTTACQQEEFDPTTAFTKIYDSYRGSEGYYPIDFMQTSSGYIILTGQTLDESDYLGVKLIRVDEEGNFLSEDDLSADYVAPVGDMVTIDSVGYFFAMNPTTLNPVLFSVTDEGYEATDIAGLDYPLAANVTSANELLLLGCDLSSSQMTLATVGTDGSANISRYEFGAGSDMESQIINHLVDPEKGSLPFFCGEWTNGSYYFNGIYDFTMSLVFTQGIGEVTGRIMGQNLNGGITSALVNQGSEFALFGFQFNDNFILPNATVNTNNHISISNYIETPISEFKSRSNADIVKWENAEQSYTIIAAETESRQIALYIYQSATGELAGIHKIGYINPYTLGSIKVDENGDVLILGTTYLSGRFKRVFFSKIPASDLEKSLN